MSEDHEVADNLAEVRAGMARAAAAAGRAPAEVTLVAVSKTHGPERIRPALAAGQRVFGENRVQEAKAKWPALKAEFPDITLHLIGPLQTNKVREALDLFDVIETLDRPRLAQALATEMARSGRRPSCLVEVNIGAEPQKAGIVPAQTAEFVALCRDQLGLPVVGLMCIPPVDQDPARHFDSLRGLAAACGLARLSMGMSHDFEAAVAHGATHVRVGTAIFGVRAKPERRLSPAESGAEASDNPKDPRR